MYITEGEFYGILTLLNPAPFPKVNKTLLGHVLEKSGDIGEKDFGIVFRPPYPIALRPYLALTALSGLSVLVINDPTDKDEAVLTSLTAMVAGARLALDYELHQSMRLGN